MKIQSYITPKHLVLLSFTPIFVKGFEYLLIGNTHPLLVATIIGLPLAVLIWFKQSIWALKIWSVLLIGYGTIRLLLSTTLLFVNKGVEAAIQDQLTPSYFIWTISFLALGIFLYRRRRQLV